MKTSNTLIGVSYIVLGAISVQFGAALATIAIPQINIAGVLLFRMIMLALVTWAICIPRIKQIDLNAVKWGLLFAVPLLGMNASIYAAFKEIGLGLAVTIELSGPLILAVITSKSKMRYVYGVITFIGVALVSGPSLSTNFKGIAFALLAATFWALYLIVGRQSATKVPGLLGVAIASLAGIMVLVPINIFYTDWTVVDKDLFILLLGAGFFSSAVVYVLDILALKRLPLSLTAQLMSLHPIAAVLFGMLIIGERPIWVEIIGLFVIATINVVVVQASSTKVAKELQMPAGK